MKRSEGDGLVTNSVSVVPANLAAIEHFVVLMLENRSFDHILGALKAQNPAIDGALDGEYVNLIDPAVATSQAVKTGPTTSYCMAFDPGHEFQDVQIQLYGRAACAGRKAAPRVQPAPLSGFVYSAENAAQDAQRAAAVMQCFHPERVPVLTALATQFAVFNYWHASVPGPTWPNRFFVHAGTSGGLSDSPKDPDILAGYTFPGGTIYQRLEQAGKHWRIYHDGLPQTAGIDSLRTEFVDVLTHKFREMDRFVADLKAGDLPDYVFIEPNYDTGHQYINGNSMHPLNDVRKGEQLIKQVYEAIRASDFWSNTMLVITFDEHGGFFDHVPPPPVTAPAGDQRYRNTADDFSFDLLGIRVPAIVVSAYTQKGTVVGHAPHEYYDHTSVLATLEKRFGLPPLSQRDKAAQARTLDEALNLTVPRTTPDDAPLKLPTPLADGWIGRLFRFLHPTMVTAATPMSDKQRIQLTLAHAVDLQLLKGPAQTLARQRYLSARTQADAAGYIQDVENRVRSRRQAQ
jgi:phospholipase C